MFGSRGLLRQSLILHADKFGARVKQLLGEDYEERFERVLQAVCAGETIRLRTVTVNVDEVAALLDGNRPLAQAVVDCLKGA